MTPPVWMGIDEAGAGEVVGSFYLGYVKTTEPELLEGLDLRDSKSLNRTSLEEKFSEVSGLVETGVLPIYPSEIEEMAADGVSLTEMEDHAIASLVASATPDVLQVDCYYPREEMLVDRLRGLMQGQSEDVDLRVGHAGESKWPLVAAAGIVAKVHQKWELDRLRHVHGDVFGSGNGSDSRTRSFVDSMGEESYFVRKGSTESN